MKKMLYVLIVLLTLAPLAAFAQETEPDPAIQAAKEATVVVYDLGRFFGYVLTMVEEEEDLDLTTAQLEEFHEIMTEIKNMERIEPEWAEEKLDYLELDILSVEQLLAVDELAIAREEGRETGAGESQQKGGGSGSGSLSTFVAGGAFNPIVDETKSLGEGFAELYSYVSRKLGR